MKKEIQTTHPIAAPAASIWENIRTGKGVDTWLPAITSCRVEGNKRFCEAGEATLKETIVSSDDATMTFRYTIEEQNLLPVTDIAGTMRVEAVDQDNCLLHWDVTMDIADEAMFPEVEGTTRAFYAAGAVGLGQLAAA